MTKSELKKIVKEVLTGLQEANVTGGTATFSPGTGAQYATPFAFSKKGILCIEQCCYSFILVFYVKYN